MKWDIFTAIEQLIILLTIAGQIWIACKVILNSDGTEQYVRIMSYATGILMFLITKALGLTFAHLLLSSLHQQDSFMLILIGAIVPFLVGALVSEVTIIAIGIGTPVLTRFVLMLGYVRSGRLYQLRCGHHPPDHAGQGLHPQPLLCRFRGPVADFPIP
jgi:hypothetical protein